jgi:O-antigen/teichoic acid export membrane protein
MNVAGRIVKNTGILYAKMAITVFISLYTTRLVLVSLGVTDFGIFNLVSGTISMLTFLNTAMAAATQRFMSYAEGAGDERIQKQIFNVSIVLHLLIAIFVVILLEVMGHFLFKGVFNIPVERISSAKLIFQFMAVSTFFTIISVPYDAVINAHENMMLYAVMGVLEALLKLGIAVVVMSHLGDNLVTYGLLTALLALLLLAVKWVYCRLKYLECETNLRLFFDHKVFMDLGSFAAWSFLGSATSILANYGQGILMNSFFGPVVNAAQSIAAQVSGQLGAFASTMQKALNPVIDKSEGAGNRSLMLKTSSMGSKVSFFLLILMFIPALVEMPFIFRCWLKDVPTYAVVFCRLLLFRNLTEQLFINLSLSISAVGNIKRFQVFTSLLNIFPLSLTYMLFFLHYPPYFIYLVFIGYAVMNDILLVYFAKKLCGLDVKDYLVNVGLRCILSFLVILAFSSLPIMFMESTIVRLFLVILICFVSYGFVIWNVGFNKVERLSIYNLIASITNDLKLKMVAGLNRID